jgi:hypothetical protein
VPKTGRSLIGTVAGFKSEWWPVFDRNAGRLHVGIRTKSPKPHDVHHPFGLRMFAGADLVPTRIRTPITS